MGERGDFQECFPQKKSEQKKIFNRYKMEANTLFEQYFKQLTDQVVPPLSGDGALLKHHP